MSRAVLALGALLLATPAAAYVVGGNGAVPPRVARQLSSVAAHPDMAAPEGEDGAAAAGVSVVGALCTGLGV
eukprot:CAMPEP_0117546584 /NCGR_PEP_ID=MMETSP0784-20121206/46680_1 /TAXON_ID=39447 /ORGANISM="" /LENGTH=71 /DNA_ID=CAMNT_0005343455 /DNA_START=81 /DNA_END=292 /DNA_ORIENTATION=-